MILNLIIDRQKGCGSMVLGPIELDAAANPGAGEANQCRFDDRLAIKQVITVGLVLQHVNAATNFRQDHGANKFVLDPNGFPFSVNRFFAPWRSEEHTSELQSHSDLVCRLLLE